MQNLKLLIKKLKKYTHSLSCWKHLNKENLDSFGMTNFMFNWDYINVKVCK